MVVRKRHIGILLLIFCLALPTGVRGHDLSSRHSSNGHHEDFDRDDRDSHQDGHDSHHGDHDSDRSHPSNGGDFTAHVYQHGQRLYFERLPDANAFEGKTVTLRLRFDGVGTFNASALRLAVNGERADVDSWANHSAWVDDHGPVLNVRISDASFWGHRTFAQVLRTLHHHRGHLRIWVHAPATVRSAVLSLPSNPPPPPRVVIDDQRPAESVFTASFVTFAFHVDGTADRTECSLDSGGFQTCASPATFNSLREGMHQFRVRAVSGRRHGPVNTVWFTVVPPAVTITSVDPSTSPTGRSDIRASFHISSDLLGSVSAQCRVDNGNYEPCTSPVSFTRLGQGGHRLDIQRVTRFMFLSWTWYPTSYFWQIQTQTPPPTIAFTATPPASTKDASATFAIQADQSNVTFQCVLDNGAAQACPSPFTVSSLSEGGHRLQVTGFGATNLASSPIAFSWVTDYTAPTLTAQVSPPQSPTSSQAMSVSFSPSEEATVACRLDNGAPISCASPWSLSGLSEGTHSVSLQATDSVGNLGEPWTYSWVVDLTAPAVTILLTSPTSLPTNQTTATFALSATEAAAYSCSLDNGAAFACAAQVNLSALSDGPHTLSAVATDHAGNNSAPASFSWTVDTTAPVITIGEVTPSENPTAHTDIQIAFNVNEAATVQCNRDHAGYAPCNSPFVDNGLADGTHVVELSAADHAGNLSQVASYTWTVSSTANATLDNVVPGNSPTNINNIAFSFSSPQSDQFVCSLDGAAPSACLSPRSYSGLADGAHQFSVSALNALGNAGPPAVYRWVIDTVAPVLNVSYLPAEDPTASNSIRADFSLSEAGSVSCQLDANPAAACVSPFIAANLVDGSHTLTLTATDSAGNQSSKTRTWRVITNVAVSIGAVSPSGALVNQSSISIAFSSPNASGFDCSLDGATPTSCTSPFTRTVADGAHHFAVRGLNPAGSPGTAATYDWTSDTAAPSLTLGAATPSQNPTSVTTLQLAYTTNETATVSYSLDGAAPVAASGSPVSVSGLADGDHTLSLTPKDSAGNEGSAQTYSWRVITVANVTLGAASPAGGTVASHGLSLTFSSTNATQFTCSLDGASAASCTSPYAVTVTDGTHSISVRALNPSGQPGPAATYSWTADTTPPVIALSANPAQSPTASTSLSMSFSANESANWDCSLDGAAAAPCASPYQANNLGDGGHSLVIGATDAVGNRATSSHSWQILSVATVAIGTPSPSSSVTTNQSISIPFSSNNSTRFVCSLDGAAAASCSSPATYGGLSDGQHTFSVSALNPASQPGPAATYSWTVDSTAPTVTITGETPAWSPTSQTQLTISFSAEAGATFTCAVDGAASVSCSSPWVTPVLTDGAHSLSIIAADSVGNASMPATYSWTVDTTPLVANNISADAATQTSTTVRWTTNVGATSQVFFTPNGGSQSSTTVDGNYVTTHAVALTGLRSNTVYTVFARSVDRDGRTQDTTPITFRTQR